MPARLTGARPVALIRSQSAKNSSQVCGSVQPWAPETACDCRKSSSRRTKTAARKHGAVDAPGVERAWQKVSRQRDSFSQLGHRDISRGRAPGRHGQAAATARRRRAPYRENYPRSHARRSCRQFAGRRRGAPSPQVATPRTGVQFPRRTKAVTARKNRDVEHDVCTASRAGGEQAAQNQRRSVRTIGRKIISPRRAGSRSSSRPDAASRRAGDRAFPRCRRRVPPCVGSAERAVVGDVLDARARPAMTRHSTASPPAGR